MPNNDGKPDYFKKIFSKLTREEAEFLTQYQKESSNNFSVIHGIYDTYYHELRELMEPRGCECFKKCKESWCNNPFTALSRRLREGGYNELIEYLKVIKEKNNAETECDEWRTKYYNKNSDYENYKRKYEEVERKLGNLQIEKRDLQREKDEWRIKFNDKNEEYEDYKDKYDNVKEELNKERLRYARDIGNEKLKNKDDSATSDKKIARLEEKLEASGAQSIGLKKQLTDTKEELRLTRIEGENKIARLENKLDEKSNQLITLRLESGEKDNQLKLKEKELERKNEEIEDLKKLAKGSDKRAEKSQGDLLNEKIRSEKRSLELFANQELKIDMEQIYSLSKYHERLFIARKTHNQANIDVHEGNISRTKKELQERVKISVINLQEICQKCERIAEFNWELNQIQQQYEAQQEVPPHNNN